MIQQALEFVINIIHKNSEATMWKNLYVQSNLTPERKITLAIWEFDV
jgi:hypothetical protein